VSDSTPVDDIARRVAARLAADLSPALPEQVEQELARDPLEQPSERLVDPISLGALIVSIASLGWTIYHDLKKDHATAAPDQAKEIEWLAEELQAQPETQLRPANLIPEHHELIIAAIAAEIVRSRFS
jgi:hypothetical protein